MRLTRQWNNKKEQVCFVLNLSLKSNIPKHESGRDLFIPRLTAEAVEHLPQGMAEAMLEQLIIEASDESKTIIERKTAVMNTSAFRYRFPDAADFDAWYKEETNSSSKKEKLLYVIRQSLHQKKVSQDEVDAWVLEGITNFPGRGIGEPLLEMFRGIDRSLLSIPVRCAMWDYVTELRINEPEATDYSKNSPSPIFQSIIDGDFQEFKAQASALEQVLPSLVFDECNLLHFAIVCKQIEIMRYLMVEKDFIIGEGEGHIQVLKSLLFDPEAGTMLVEMDLCYALAHKKLFKRSEVYNKRMGPLEIFFEQQALALIAEAGSMTLMDIIDRAYRDPFRMQLVEEGAEECNPLYGALQTRRFLTFGKLLDWGAPYTRTFSPDAVIDGIPLLIHAIRSMAPFFVGALLANGAKVNEMNPTKAGYEASPLYEACFSLTERYKASLQRRQALHEEMGFSARVLKQDELAISSSEIDFKAMQKLILHLLLRNGANINLGARFPPDPITRERAELTPLLICIQKNNEELAIFLIEMGAEINPPDSTLTPLQLAINKNLPGVVDCLLARGASPDGAVPLTLGPPLVNAIAYNRLEMFELLLNKGASLKIEVPLYDGELVLHAILEQTSEAYLRDLSQDQLEATLRTASSPSLEMLIQDKRRQRQILLAHLRNMPRDKLTQLINHPTPAGATIIFFATEYIQGEAEDLELLRLIIENTTDINARIAPGYSAFEKAIALGNTAFTSVFLRQVMGNLRLG
jgi:ankyrin repeat protein